MNILCRRLHARCVVLLICLYLSYSAYAQQKKSLTVLEAPAQQEFCQVNPEGVTVIPNGRLIKPLGKTVRIAPHPFGLALSPDGKTVITSNSGTSPFSISILRNIDSASPKAYQIPEGAKTDDDLLSAVFMGLAVSPDNLRVYVAGGNQNKVFVFDLNSRRKLGEIQCGGIFGNADYRDGYIGDMVLSADGRTLYAVDQIGFRVVVMDVLLGKVLRNLPTGRYPFGIALSPDERNLFVANVGMFEYSYVQSLDSNNLMGTALKFPAFAYGSKEMREGIRNDSVQVKGLGDPNAQESFSVWAYDLSGADMPVKAKIKTGVKVGDMVEGIPAVGGSSPNSIVAGKDYVYVSNGNNDNITVINTRNLRIEKHIELKIEPALGNRKGIIPFGLALSPDGRSLFVAESGINAVAVIDVPSHRVLGHLPVGWFPSKLKVTPDGKRLIVANAKGYGSGPNGGSGFTPGPEGSYIGNLMKGSITILDIPDRSHLPELTETVKRNNFRVTQLSRQEATNRVIPAAPGVGQSPIRHIVFISKENRTYDEVYGQWRKGKGDPGLARYGADVTFYNRGRTDSVVRATVMPNHLELARRFAMSDNFYVDADVSADGHRWLANTYPNEWMETHHPASYGGKRDPKPESKAPGKFGMTGAAGAIFPEDYNQHGSMWDHLARHGIEFYNFGFGVEMGTGNISDSTLTEGGVRYLVNYPVPGPLYDRTSRRFPTYNMAIPDQYRADVFIDEIRQRYVSAGKPLPAMITLQLLNDHGAGERPHAGFPFAESYMGDNDLALGRVVEFLSSLPEWKHMLIVVTEDDAQGGRDHVDAHRSILQVISPYARRDYVSHIHYSFGSIFKTFWNILGLPYLNQYDASATDLNDCFSAVPDFSPYRCQPVDARVFDPVKALKPFQKGFDWKALQASPGLDNVDYIREVRKEEEGKEQRP